MTVKRKPKTPQKYKDTRKHTLSSATLVGYHGITEEEAAFLEQRLREGETPNQLAIMIQDKWGKATTISKQAVLMKLLHYRNVVMGSSILIAAARINPQDKGEILDRIRANVDVLTELQDLVAIQKRRLEKALRLESRVAGLRMEASGSIRLLAELLSRTADIQFDLGIMTRVPKRLISATVDQTTVTATDCKVQISQDDYQHRLMSIIDLVGSEMKTMPHHDYDVVDVQAETVHGSVS